MDLDHAHIAVIGLGYVGLPLALAFGRTRDVIGFDIDANRIEALRRGEDATLEASAVELAEATRLQFTSQTDSLRQCGIFIVTVPTPIDRANRPDLGPLIRASEAVGKVISPGAVVIFESTVYPGCTEEVCAAILERCSGLEAGYRAFHDLDEDCLQSLSEENSVIYHDKGSYSRTITDGRL